MSVAVLRFHAGSHVFAVAAGTVATIGPSRSDVPHLSQVFGQSEPSVDLASARLLEIVGAGQRASVVVDGPVGLVQLDVGDITPCRDTTSPSVLGFALVEGEPCVLLDAIRLVERVVGLSGPRV